MPRAYSSGGRVARGIPRTNAGRAALAEYPILQGTSGCAQILAIPDDSVADEPIVDGSLVPVARLARALLPVITLYVGKLIIDDVVMLVQMPDKPVCCWNGSTAIF